MKEYLKKLTSRKFIMAAMTAISGIAVLCGANRDVVTTIAGAAMALVSALVYCITEGRIDAASIRSAAGAIGDAAVSLGADETVQNVIDAMGEMIVSPSEEQVP